MSDLPATVWILLAVWLLEGPTPRPLAAGVAAGLSFVTRPGGLGAVVVLAGLALATETRDRWRRVTWFAVGVAPLLGFQAWLQWHLYGSPMRSGYGAVTDVFAGASVLANLGIYADAIWRTHAWIWLAGLVAALAARRRPILLAAAMLGTTAIPYLLYWRFEHWETLRFLLPAIVLLTIAAAGGLAHVAEWRAQAAAPLLLALAAVAVAVSSERFLRDQGVPGLREAEARYPRVAARLAATTPDTAVVLAVQHSGSIRQYAGRQTLRWDVLEPSELAPVVEALTARGHAVFVALEGDEQRQFEQTFASALTGLRRIPAGQVGIVQIWQLDLPGSGR